MVPFLAFSHSVSATASIEGGNDGGNSGDISPMMVAAPKQFPVPPPPEMFQSGENLRTYVYDKERSSTHSGEKRQSGGRGRDGERESYVQ